jgi:hypothetical protein
MQVTSKLSKEEDEVKYTCEDVTVLMKIYPTLLLVPAGTEKRTLWSILAFQGPSSRLIT